MKQERQEFETTKGLLKDVMRKQAGSIEKAVLEAVMNAIDAGATSVDVDIDRDTLTVSDNGKGMTKDEVDKYFKKFGLKDDDIEDKEFGKFRMGRGQIFNFGVNVWHTQNNILVVNLEEPHTEVDVGGSTETVDTSGLSYVWLESEDSYDGCRIEVDLYHEVEEVDNTVKEIENQIQYMSWFHDVEITVNNKLCDDEFKSDYKTDHAYFEFNRGSYSSRSTIFNKGARVKREQIGPVFATIISREDLDLNFARNDILKGCPVWEAIKKEYNQSLRSHLLEAVEYSVGETNWLIQQASDDTRFWEKLYDKDILTDLAGVTHSLSSLEDRKITFASKNDSVAQEMCRRTDTVVIPEALEGSFKGEDTPFTVTEYEDALDKNFQFELKKYSEDNLSKRRRQNLERLRWALKELEYYGTVESGNSKHRNVWMNDDTTILVDKDFLNNNKNELATTVLLECMREAAHNKDTRQDPEEGFGYDRRLKNMLDNMPFVQKQLLANGKEVKKYVKRADI